MVVTTEEDGKYYSYAIKISSSENLVAMTRKHPEWKSANIYSTKKRAYEVVDMLRESYKSNCTYYIFDSPMF